MNIFVSYTTRDHHIKICLLEAVSDVVSEYGRPFIDLIHNDSDDKQAYVERKLLSSDLVLLLLTDSINQSKWVQWELAKAKNNKIPVITVPINSEVYSDYLDDIRAKLSKEVLVNSYG